MQPSNRPLAVLAAALLALLAACGAPAPEDSASGASASGDTAPGDTAEEQPAGPATTAAAAFPLTVTADNGEVTVESEPAAIVSLSPSLTEMLYAVGAGDQVVAVDSSSNHPPDAPVTDLSGFRPNVEAVAELDPDLVLLARDRDDVVATLTDVGIPVILLEAPDDLEEVYTQIETVGNATGHPAEGEAAAEEVRTGVAEVLAEVPPRTEPLSYLYELTGEYHTLTSDTFVGSLLDLAGMENIADGADPAAGPYPQLNAEYVLDADPDLVFLAHSDGSVPTDDEIAARPGWTELTAVAQDRVIALDPDISSRWGPRVVELLRSVVDATARIGS